MAKDLPKQLTTIDFSNGRRRQGGASAPQLPRHEVLSYIHDMCTALSYLASTKHCDGLSELLLMAAEEAEREGVDNVTHFPSRSETK